MRVVVCNVGLGNVASVVRALDAAASLGGDAGRTHAAGTASGARRPSVALASTPEDVRSADYVVVPGQGAFGPFAAAMGGARGLGDALRAHIGAGRPYLGICLGMQALFETSEEAAEARGLGIFAGHVARLRPGVDPATGRPRALPHMGWNSVERKEETSPAAERFFYFAHTFAAVPSDPSIVEGETVYGNSRFVSAIRRDNVRGAQFHPEKSQREGLAYLAAFLGS